MDPVDYSDKYNRARDIFQRKVTEQSRANDQEVKGINERYERKLAEQSENYVNSKRELEENYNDRYEQIDKAQAKAIKEKDKLLEKRLYETKNNFSNLTREQKRAWELKFRELNNEYRNTFEDQEALNKAIRDQQARTTNERVDAVIKKSQQEIDDFRKEAVGGSNDVRDKINLEKREMAQGYERKINNVYKEELDKRNDLKQRVSKDIARIREVRDAERVRNRDMVRNNFKRVNEDAARKISSLSGQFNDTITRVNQAQAKETKAQNQIFSDRFVEQEKRNQANLRKLENKAKSMGVGSGSLQKEMVEKQREEEAIQAATRVDGVLRERNENIIKYDKAMSDQVENFSDVYRKKTIRNAAEKEKLKRDLTELNIEERLRDRRRFEKVNKDHILARSQEKEEANRQYANAKEQAAKQINTLKKEFNETITDATDRSQLELEFQKKEFNREKRELTELLHEQNSYRARELRQKHTTEMEKLGDKYEEKLEVLRNKNLELRLQMENKIRNISEITAREIDRQRKELVKAAEIEKGTIRQNGEANEKELRNRIRSIHEAYIKKLNESRIDNEQKLKQMSFGNDIKLKNMEEKYQDVIDHNQRFFERELARLQASTDMERSRLINQYETRIKALRKASIDKQRELEQFNSLQRS